MNKTITVTIPGNPIAKKRPRFVRRSEFVGTYNPQETEEGRFMAHFHNNAGIGKPLTGPIVIEIEFALKRPKSHYGTGKNNARLKDSSSDYHTCKPDIDNLVKFVFDSLNGCAWVDDSQIVTCFSEKRYTSNHPYTSITITEVKDGK